MTPSSVHQPVAAVIYNPVKIDPVALRAAIDAEAERNGWGPSLWVQTTVDDPGQKVAARALASNAHESRVKATTQRRTYVCVPTADLIACASMSAERYGNAKRHHSTQQKAN